MRGETRRPLAWNGTVSGPVSVTGELTKGQAGNLLVNTRLTIQRAEGEDPVDGLIDLSYNQSAGSIDFEPSYVATRYSRTEFSGRLGLRVAVSVETSNLSEYMQPIGAFTKGHLRCCRLRCSAMDHETQGRRERVDRVPHD